MGALAAPILLDVPRRFGAVFFPLFLLLLAAAAQSASLRAVRASSRMLILTVGVCGLCLICGDLRYLQPGMVQTWAISKGYVEAVGTSSEPVLFALNDASTVWSSDEALRRFAGYPGRLIRLNDFGWGESCHGPRVTVEPGGQGSVTVVSTVDSACGQYNFVNAYPAIGPGVNHFTRQLPEAQIDYALTASPRTNTLTVHLFRMSATAGLLAPESVGRELHIPLGKGGQPATPSNGVP